MADGLFRIYSWKIQKPTQVNFQMIYSGNQNWQTMVYFGNTQKDSKLALKDMNAAA